MCEVIEQRFDAAHKSCVSVVLSEIFDKPWVFEDLRALGVMVYSPCSLVRDLFDLGPMPRDYANRMAKAVKRAQARSEVVLHLWMCKHSDYVFRFLEAPCRPAYGTIEFFDSRNVGVAICSRKRWEANLKLPYCQSAVLKALEPHEALITAFLNGRICEWVYEGADGEYVTSGPEFPDGDSALQAALSEYPQCRYEASDFLETRIFRLHKVA